MTHALRALFIVSLLLLAGFAAGQSVVDTQKGRRVDFPLTRFNDTLFAAVTGAYRVRSDDDGHVWYTTEAGVVRIDPDARTRELYTKVEGLPSSFSMGLAIKGDDVYVGTDLGIAVIHRHTGEVRAYGPFETPLPDAIVQEVALVGDDVWFGTRFFGVGIWNSTRPIDEEGSWTFKNTSTKADYASPVTRIVPTERAVYVATAGDGLWRHDRATGDWTAIVEADGLPTGFVTGAAERGDELWIATSWGLVVRYPNGTRHVYQETNSGLVDDRLVDVDVVRTIEGSLNILASSHRGIWQLEPDSGANQTLAQSFGILGHRLYDAELHEDEWLIGSTRGVSLLRNEVGWQYFTTGPSQGPSWGPVSSGYTAAGVGDNGPFLWFGAAEGLSAYRLPRPGEQGYWQNFGEWQNYPGGTINWIDTLGNVTWFATTTGVYGFEHDTGRWIPKLAVNSRNLAYGVEADRGELWIALFGDGLIMENLTDGTSRSWSYATPENVLPDQYLTDVRADGDTIWLGASLGIIRLDRATGTIRASYGSGEGIPGSGVVFRVVPDGAIVWVGTNDGGVAQFDVASGRVTRVWNATTTPGFPAGEVRSMHREGGRLWVGLDTGLVRIDVANGAFTAWNQTSSDLVQSHVNGISSAQGLLYLATLSGIQRMDIQTGRFYPLRDGPGIIRGDPSLAPVGGSASTGLSVRIEAPRDGAAVAGPTQIAGSAFSLGSSVDRVEVRIGTGAWTRAQGTESWTLEWDPSALPTNEPVVIAARAVAGDATAETDIVVTPIAPPTVPLSIEPIEPSQAFANRPLQFGARVRGDEPLSAYVYYKPDGRTAFSRLALQPQGDGLYLGSIPARDVQAGVLRYYYEAQSGLLIQSAAGDARTPSAIDVSPAPRLAVAVDAPALVEARAGQETQFRLNVTNAGTEPATFRLNASGLRSTWLSLPGEDLELDPAETREIVATLIVPREAFSDNTTIAFEARDARGIAEPATATVPVRILGADEPTTGTPTLPTSGNGEGGRGSFIPLHPAVALAAVALALVLRRRSA